jgi:hypothetical protein
MTEKPSLSTFNFQGAMRLQKRQNQGAQFIKFETHPVSRSGPKGDLGGGNGGPPCGLDS